MNQIRLIKCSSSERQREGLCALCHTHRHLCGKSFCPLFVRSKVLTNLEKVLRSREFLGASPPGVFVGSWGYPKVLAGPLVPPMEGRDTSIMDAPELWLGRTFEEVLGYRLALIRGKIPMHVEMARNPPRLLTILQEEAMASSPTDTEVRLRKEPRLGVFFSPRAAPLGPSASLESLSLAENPSIPREVERTVSDGDLKAIPATVRLYEARIPERQIVRLLSVGLLGTRRHRRLVPTEWSITAVDDIIGESLRRRILDYPEINGIMLLGARGFGNNVQLLLFPSPWMFEALEAWNLSIDPTVVEDYELSWGRSTYPYNLAGAYHATRLPILEYLESIKRQSAAIAFLEVGRDWIPLGVWRFRELAREALRRPPIKFDTLEEALSELKTRLEIPMAKWIRASRLIFLKRGQRRIEAFL
ncbi:hypothetical protein KEJ19_02725 [Candidatus Bathyarchaeota archaeon]|nr:hypothetical protein [Candidatus Bathyarchaeota archaeon]